MSVLSKILNWQMFTNGMRESASSMVCLKDVPLEAFKIMLEFMYTGELNKEATGGINTLLLQLLLLADEFGVTLLHQECCKILLECLSEVILRLFPLSMHTSSFVAKPVWSYASSC